MNPQPLNGKSLHELAPMRVGRFIVSNQLLEQDAVWRIFSMMKFVPMLVGRDQRHTHYSGRSPRFEPLHAARTVPLDQWPMYTITVDSEECAVSGKRVIAWVHVKKQAPASVIQIARA